MSFDPRSLERLRQLGRNLPQPLPAPEPPPAPARRQHRVETEQNPEQLFRELMQASSDGSVPPHLLDRLRQLEATRGTPAAAAGAAAATPASAQRRPGRRQPAPPSEDQALYEAFADLLSLEDDNDGDDAPPPPRRQIDDRLRPKPAVRPRRPGEG